MALHPSFPDGPHAILDPAIRWFPALDSFAALLNATAIIILVVSGANELYVWNLPRAVLLH